MGFDNLNIKQKIGSDVGIQVDAHNLLFEQPITFTCSDLYFSWKRHCLIWIKPTVQKTIINRSVTQKGESGSHETIGKP